MNLLTSNNIVFLIGTVTKGVYPEADGSRELYKIVNDEGTFYAVTEGFEPHTVEDIPEEVCPDKWCYTEEDGFYKNPNYVKPEWEQKQDLEETIDFLVMELLGGK